MKEDIELSKNQLITLKNICKKGWGGYSNSSAELDEMVENGLITKSAGPFDDVVYRPTDDGYRYIDSLTKYMTDKIGNITLINDDCMNILRELPDKCFDLAIVDPPFGIGQNWRKNKRAKFYHHQNNFNDSTPGKEYFSELFRVSKNQIIWGCNYYWNFLRPTNNLIFWDKGKDAKKQHGSAGELAWTSFTRYPFMKYDFMWNGCCMCEKANKIHPHQKPIMLYKQLLNDFASAGDKILDTFLGSGSIAIACNDLGFELTGIEMDGEYFIATRDRLIAHQKQLQLIF